MSNKCVVKIDEGFERGKKKIRYRGGNGNIVEEK